MSIWRYLGWLGVGFCVSFGLIAGFSIGIFAWPVLIVLLVVMNTVGRSRDDDRGLGWASLAGVGICAGLIYAINPGWWPLLPATILLIGLGVALPIGMARSPGPLRS